jgi:hypothetical protein
MTILYVFEVHTNGANNLRSIDMPGLAVARVDKRIKATASTAAILREKSKRRKPKDY